MDKISQCVQALLNGNLDKAYKILNEVKNKGNDEEKSILADELSSLGFLEEASELYKILVNKHPNRGDLLISLSETLINFDQEEEALLYLHQIKSNDPSYIESLLLQADLYQMQGLFEVSEQKLLEAEQLDPEEEVIQFALAELYASIGRFSEAIYRYEIVLKETDEIGGINIIERLAEVYSVSGEFEKALKFYEEATKDRLDVNLLFGYGLTAFQAAQFQTAIQKLEEVKSLDPDYESVYLPLAQSYEKELDLNGAYKTVVEGTKINPYHKELKSFGGRIAIKLGKEEEAEGWLRDALSMDPIFIEALITLSNLLLSQNRYEEVIELLEPIISEGDEDPYLLWDYAVANQEEERFDEALNAYERAYSILKNNEEFLQNFGFFLLEEGNQQRAVEIFKQLHEMDSGNIEYIDVLERLENHIS